MKLHNIELLDWVKTQSKDLVDLASSGMKAIVRVSDLGIDISDLPLWGDNQYGYPALKEILAECYNTDVDHIAITPSASMANFSLLTSFLEEGDTTAVETPQYEPFRRLAAGLTAKEPIWLVRHPENGYRIDPDIDLLKYHKPKVVIFTNLYNPGGIYEKPEVFLQIADAVSQWNGWVIIDEIFLPFLEDYQTKTAAVSHERIFITSSLSKCWGLQGLRIGWIVGKPEQLKRVRLLMNSFHAVQPFITEYLAFQVLSNQKLVESILVPNRRRAALNWELVKAVIDSSPLLDYVNPSGGISVFVRFRDGRNAGSFCNLLKEEYRTLIVPGQFFNYPSGFRICFGIDESTLKVGLKAISIALDNTQ